MSTLLKTLSSLVLATAMLFGNGASAAEAVAIPFADLGNIRDWHSKDPEVLYVESRQNEWFRITFWAPCFELPFATGIAFVTDSFGALDKYSSILANGQRCYFRSFEKSAPPPGELDN